jgi:hypothetical protein
MRTKSRLRSFVEVLSAAVLLGTFAAALVHGEFEAMKAVVAIAAVATFVLLIVGAVLQPWRRTQTVGRFVTRCGIVTLLAIPAAFVAARIVVEVDLWRAKRYIARQIAPRLEQHRASRASYPKELRQPENAPWLIRRFNYASDGRTYTLSVWDPGVCGRIASYSSATRQWTETYDPCWY